MEGRKIVLFIPLYFKHVYTLFVELQWGKLQQTSVCLGIVLYCCRTSGHTYSQPVSMFALSHTHFLSSFSLSCPHPCVIPSVCTPSTHPLSPIPHLLSNSSVGLSQKPSVQRVEKLSENVFDPTLRP